MRRRSWTGWRFAGPFLAVFALVFLAPIGYSIYLSLYRTRLVGGTSFVGVRNYTDALTDPQFWSAFGRVAVFLAVQVPIMLFLALLVALAIDSGRLHGAAFFRISIFLPYAVPAVVATLMWGFMYGTRFGLVGNLDSALGITLPDPLSPSFVLASIGNIVTWEFAGYNMLILYSALRVVDPQLYEAAAIDGAAAFKDKQFPYFGGQKVNQVLAGAAASVVPGWSYLPFQVYANSVFGDTAGKAYLGGTTLADGLKSWQDASVKYGKDQGFTIA